MFSQDVVNALKKKIEDTNDGHDFEYPGAEVTIEERQGGEGEGEHYHIIYRVTNKYNETVYVRATATYSSWDGTDWSYGSVEAVVPFEKTVRAWRKEQ